MPKYNVTGNLRLVEYRTSWVAMTIEADDEDEAEEKFKCLNGVLEAEEVHSGTASILVNGHSSHPFAWDIEVENYDEDAQWCDGCGAQIEEGRIGYCDGCLEIGRGEDDDQE